MKLFNISLLCVSLAGSSASAQFTVMETHTSASLRGIDAVSPKIAWASGSAGTVLLTTDGGSTWKPCAVPAGAEKLDFRGVQGFDAKSAVVMASGKGDQSALYQTTDGCATWKLMFRNPDPDGFWDALWFDSAKRAAGKRGLLLGDPVDGRFTLFETRDAGAHWTRSRVEGLKVAAPGIGGFAASNSGLLGETLQFGTSGPGGPFVYSADFTCTMESNRRDPLSCVRDAMTVVAAKVPLEGSSASAGVFSLARTGRHIVAVGGDYSKPGAAEGTAAYSLDGGETWTAARTPPHGYRSAVAFDAATETWVAVGTNGADLSTDNGQTWSPLKPVQAGSAKAGSQENWNAIALPFVVGAKGRIARLSLATK